MTAHYTAAVANSQSTTPCGTERPARLRLVKPLAATAGKCPNVLQIGTSFFAEGFSDGSPGRAAARQGRPLRDRPPPPVVAGVELGLGHRAYDHGSHSPTKPSPKRGGAKVLHALPPGRAEQGSSCPSYAAHRSRNAHPPKL